VGGALCEDRDGRHLFDVEVPALVGVVTGTMAWDEDTAVDRGVELSGPAPRSWSVLALRSPVPEPAVGEPNGLCDDRGGNRWRTNQEINQGNP
jgi:hypothetical protein